jgi:hypothetical protein
MLHCNAQNLESVHPDRRTLDSLLAFQNHVNWPSEETDKCISFGSGEEYLRQFQFKNLAHDIECSLQLSRRVPVTILILPSALGFRSLSSASCSRGCTRFLRRFRLDSRDRPL